MRARLDFLDNDNENDDTDESISSTSSIESYEYVEELDDDDRELIKKGRKKLEEMSYEEMEKEKGPIFTEFYFWYNYYLANKKEPDNERGLRRQQSPDDYNYYRARLEEKVGTTRESTEYENYMQQ